MDLLNPELSSAGELRAAFLQGRVSSVTLTRSSWSHSGSGTYSKSGQVSYRYERDVFKKHMPVTLQMQVFNRTTNLGYFQLYAVVFFNGNFRTE